MHARALDANLFLIGVTILFALGCAGEQATPTREVAVELGATDETRAAALFRDQGCPVCHGNAAEGIDEVAPALGGLAPYWTVERLSSYLQNPEAFRAANPDFDQRRDVVYALEMPAYDGMSEQERELLSRWLMTR